jgi:hypothetical protein
MASPEQRKQYHISKNFKGINTQANRTAIDSDEFAWLENAQPIGYGNVKTVPAQTTVQVSSANLVWSGTVESLYDANVNNKEYIFAFFTDGGAEAYNATDGTKVTVANSGKFSAAGVRIAQWKNERILIIDPAKGLYNWDGTNVVSIGSVSDYGMTNLGTGYTSTPSVSFSAPNETGGVQATGSAVVLANTVVGINITETGSGYTSPPTITISGGGGANATAIASSLTFATGTVSCIVKSGGTGYTSSFAVTFSGGGGANAAGTAIVSGGSVTKVIMTNNGSGYTSAPTANVSAGAGSGAIVEAVVTTNANTDVATFSGRTWVSQGRTVFYSAADSYTDFASVSAGNILITDSTLHTNIVALLSANNFLYVFGADSINVFSDVRVGQDGVTVFTNTNVSASVGTSFKKGLYAYFRSVVFMNEYGIYALVGSTTSKLSDALDGIFQLIDFTQPVSGGQVLINNILCACWSFTYNDPVAGARPVQAVFFNKRWFMTSQGTLTNITGAQVGGLTTIYGTGGTNLLKLYANSTTAVAVTWKSALWPLGDPIRDKQALKFGVEATLGQSGSLSLTVDSEYGSSPSYTLANTLTWYNNSLQTIPWTNNSSAQIGWIAAGYQLYKSDAQQYGKYLGFTITGNVAATTLHTLELEHEMRARF